MPLQPFLVLWHRGDKSGEERADGLLAQDDIAFKACGRGGQRKGAHHLIGVQAHGIANERHPYPPCPGFMECLPQVAALARLRLPRPEERQQLVTVALKGRAVRHPHEEGKDDAIWGDGPPVFEHQARGA